MKKIVIIAICLLVLLLVVVLLILRSGKPASQDETTPESTQTVTLINSGTQADVWILPDTQTNRKTTLWGTATAAKIGTGESRQIPLCEPGDDGLYLFRAIDADGFYDSANGLLLKDGWVVQIKADDPLAVSVLVTDEKGVPQNTYDAFSAKL